MNILENTTLDVVAAPDWTPEQNLHLILREGGLLTLKLDTAAPETITLGRAELSPEQWEALARHLISKHETAS